MDRRKDISTYIFNSKYARVITDERGARRKETWNEAVDRVMNVHRSYLGEEIINKLEEDKYFTKATTAYKETRILGAQRALQFGGEQLLRHQTRLYNCSSSYLNRLDFFKESLYLLLSGCGVGYSVQKCHTSLLPPFLGVDTEAPVEKFTIPDSVEGWSMAIHKLITSYYLHLPEVLFDYSQIRPKGAYISGGFKAPGSKPLNKAIDKIRTILREVKIGTRLSPFLLHYIMCILADSVVSGGVRRSAMICLFDADDKEMLECKTGDWYYRRPELCRSNNSVVILPTTSKEMYDAALAKARQFGEPGIAFLKNQDYTLNPCAEVGMYPQFKNEDGVTEYGWSFCNLTNINGGKIKTLEDWKEAAEAAAILGTIQAYYTTFKVLSPASKKIAQRDALIGVGIAGMCSNPKLFFNYDYQREIARLIVETNIKVSKILGINPAARCTVVKPDGNSSQLLGTSSGINPYPFPRMIRHIQASNDEQAFNEIKRINPRCVEKSSYNPDNESVIAFPIEIEEGAMTRDTLSSIDILSLIYNTQRNWIEYGTNFDHPSYKENPSLRMNVSNTVTVKEGEWEGVKEFVWKNRDYFCGVSFLSEMGDIDYPLAPYTSFWDEKELCREYGPASVLSSGLIVDGLKVFDDIYQACDAAVGRADSLLEKRDNYPVYVKRKIEERGAWIERFNKFAKNYFEGDLNKCSQCLKRVNIFHKWQVINRMKEVDWKSVEWRDSFIEAGEQIGTACSGGMCELR